MTTTEPRTDLIIQVIELVFQALDVLTNFLVGQFQDVVTQILTGLVDLVL